MKIPFADQRYFRQSRSSQIHQHALHIRYGGENLASTIFSLCLVDYLLQ